MTKTQFGGMVLGLILALSALPVMGATLGQRAALQMAMQTHIEQSLVDGAYLHLDRETGAVTPLYPMAAHPTIMRMGRHFVLCADFRTEGGQSVNVDFFAAKDGASYRIFAAVVGDRSRLKQWIDDGKVERLE